MGRIYVNPSPEPDSDKPEDSPVSSGRMYIGSTDADGEPVEVLDTNGDTVTVREPGPESSSDGESTSASESDRPDGEPAGNASRDEWVEYARSQGATDDDLVDEDGKDLTRDELRAKYGSTS